MASIANQFTGGDRYEQVWREVLPQYQSLGGFNPSRKHVAPKVRVLIDFLVDAFRMQGWLP